MSKPGSRRYAAAVIALAALVAALLAYIAHQQRWSFNPPQPLYVEAPDGAGIAEGMRVTTRGVVIGSVRRIELPAPHSADQGARIELAIDHGYMAGLPKGTRARLVTDATTGQPTIDLVPPRGGAQALGPGEVLAFERNRDGGQFMQEMQAAWMPVIADARKLTERLTDPDGAFQQTLKAGQDVVSKMPAIAEKTGEVIDQTRQTVKTIESGAVATMQRAGRTIEVVEQAAPGVIDKVQQAAATSQKASADLQAMVAQASDKLPGVLDQVQAAATQTNQMVSSARQTWPISMLTGTPTTPQSLAIDSIGGLPLPGEAP